MTTNQKTIFLTGATGFLGSYLLGILLDNGYRVYALARGKDKGPEERVKAMLDFWDMGISGDKLKNLKVVEGDITGRRMGISLKAARELHSEVQIIFHSAALAKLRVPLEEIREINVGGTKNVFTFASKCKKLEKFNHISTAYIAGTKSNIYFDEDMLDMGQKFNNFYEQTKYEAEVLARRYWKKDWPVAIFRPGMVMGDSVSGKTNEFRLFYEPLHIFARGIYEAFPADMKCFQNLINVDTVGKAIFYLGIENENAVYQIVSPEANTIGFFFDTASKYFGFKLPEFTPVDYFDFKKLTAVQKTLALPYIPYFNNNTRFLSDKTQKALEKYNFKFPKIDENNLNHIFEYCVRRGFIKAVS